MYNRKEDILPLLKNKNKKAIAKVLSLLQQDSEKEFFDHLLQESIDLHSSIRIGITGSPGVGKSSFINHLAKSWSIQGKSILILTVDPSSQLSGGSLLGDQTRMTDLMDHDNIYIRPFPSGAENHLIPHLDKAIKIGEICDFDLILVESTGVGQSETSIVDYVDITILLTEPTAGDDVQTMKKGILELADIIVVHKADGLLLQTAKLKQKQLELGLHDSSSPKTILTFSSIVNENTNEIISSLEQLYFLRKESGILEKNRQQQMVSLLQRNLVFSLKKQVKKLERTPDYQVIVHQLKENQISSPEAEKLLLKLHLQSYTS